MGDITTLIGQLIDSHIPEVNTDRSLNLGYILETIARLEAYKKVASAKFADSIIFDYIDDVIMGYGLIYRYGIALQGENKIEVEKAFNRLDDYTSRKLDLAPFEKKADDLSSKYDSIYKEMRERTKKRDFFGDIYTLSVSYIGLSVIGLKDRIAISPNLNFGKFDDDEMLLAYQGSFESHKNAILEYAIKLKQDPKDILDVKAADPGFPNLS